LEAVAREVAQLEFWVHLAEILFLVTPLQPLLLLVVAVG
jgi:hypothetical protein